MHILITTSLYPPDIPAPAPYVKELARRLSGRYQVTILTYGHLPEQVPGVDVVTVNKQNSLLIRLMALAWKLRALASKADVVFIENGPSVELPAFVAGLFTRTPFISHVGDPLAETRTKRNGIQRIIAALLRLRAKQTITDRPYEKPEILPFKPRPTEAVTSYEASWDTHFKKIEEIL